MVVDLKNIQIEFLATLDHSGHPEDIHEMTGSQPYDNSQHLSQTSPTFDMDFKIP